MVETSPPPFYSQLHETLDHSGHPPNRQRHPLNAAWQSATDAVTATAIRSFRPSVVLLRLLWLLLGCLRLRPLRLLSGCLCIRRAERFRCCLIRWGMVVAAARGGRRRPQGRNLGWAEAQVADGGVKPLLGRHVDAVKVGCVGLVRKDKQAPRHEDERGDLCRRALTCM